MEQKFVSNGTVLQFKHISTATDEVVKYIEDRKDHTIESLKTRWSKFNNLCMGGIEPNAIYTITGISGSGKSSFVNTLETDLIDLNSDKDIVVLSFNFEMMSSRQVGRKLSYKLKKTTSELYSSNSDITEDTLEKVKETASMLKEYPIYYVDTPSTVKNIEATIKYFMETIAKGKWLVIILDHTLLLANEGKSNKDAIDELQQLFMQAKKAPFVSIIQITQMNRNIESSERINNPSGHYPLRSDLSTSDFIFQSSDYIIVLHRPEILGITQYGPNNLATTNMVFLHFLKNREGNLMILRFINDLKYNNLKEPEGK